MYSADEAWMCGTGVQVAAITKMDHRPIGTGKMGDLVLGLRKAFFDVVNGRNAKYRQWLHPVYAEEAVR
jgi:branched-chain amino acid aminotransferase